MAVAQWTNNFSVKLRLGIFLIVLLLYFFYVYYSRFWRYAVIVLYVHEIQSEKIIDNLDRGANNYDNFTNEWYPISYYTARTGRHKNNRFRKAHSILESVRIHRFQTNRMKNKLIYKISENRGGAFCRRTFGQRGNPFFFYDGIDVMTPEREEKVKTRNSLSFPTIHVHTYISPYS